MDKKIFLKFLFATLMSLMLTFIGTNVYAAEAKIKNPIENPVATPLQPNDENDFYGDDATNTNFPEITNAYATIDPFENLNRKTFAFNRFLDKIIIRPLAVTYDTVVPNVAQKGVNNFFNNTDEIPTIANDFLQARGKQALSDFTRLIINTTFGIGGLVDIATLMGVKKHYTDLGLTFAQWGSRNTPYFVIPFLGPSTLNDAPSLPVYYQFLTMWPMIKSDGTRYAFVAMRWIDMRDSLLPSDKVINQSFDPYSFMRNAYLQHRAYLMQKAESGQD
jgi:phospholipid-binding lipoprotein MlaA